MRKLILALGWMGVALSVNAQEAQPQANELMADYDQSIIEEKAQKESDFYEMLVNIEVLKPENTSAKNTSAQM